jgi:hypothetical protein
MDRSDCFPDWLADVDWSTQAYFLISLPANTGEKPSVVMLVCCATMKKARCWQRAFSSC